MARPRSRLLAAALAVALPTLAVIAGCSRPPEYQLVYQYFNASRLRDNATLGNIATVSFNPNEHGSVQSFEIVSVSPEERRPLQARQLAQALAEAEQAQQEFGAKKKEYQDTNLEAIERVIKAERESATLRGRDATIQEEWTKWRDEEREYARAVSEAREALSNDRGVADASVQSQPGVNVTQFDGDVVTKEVTITAQVRPPDGAATEKTLVVKLQKAELTNGPNGQAVEGRWMVTEVREAS